MPLSMGVFRTSLDLCFGLPMSLAARPNRIALSFKGLLYFKLLFARWWCLMRSRRPTIKQIQSRLIEFEPATEEMFWKLIQAGFDPVYAFKLATRDCI